MNNSFPIPPNTQHYLPWRQYELCNRLWSFSGLWPRSFSHNIVSKMARFRFVSPAIHKWKLGPLNFSLLIHVEPKYRTSFGIQSYVNDSKPFNGRCLVSQRCRETKFVGLPRFFKEFHQLFQRLAGRGEVYLQHRNFRNENEQTNSDTGVHLSTHHHKHHTIFDEPAIHFSLFGSKKAKYSMTKMTLWNLHFQNAITFDWVNEWRYLYI